MKQQNLFCFCLNDAQSTQNHTSYSTLLQVTTLIPQNSTSTCFSVPSPVMKNIIVVKASIRCVQGCKSVFLCTCERWGSSHSATSTHTRWLSKFKKKKNALRDFAAFHFMSTNKRTKKPFWREEWEAVRLGRGASRKRPLKNSERQRGESEDRKQEGKQTKLKNQSDSTTDNEWII